MFTVLSPVARVHAAGPAVQSVSHAKKPARPRPGAASRPARAPVTDESIDVRAERVAFAHAAAQHVPDATTHITAQTLINRNIFTINDLAKVAPNVTIQAVNGTATNNFYIRGVGFNDFTQNNISSVMTYVDDVAFPLATMTDGMMFDMAGVDVTPGPVGTTHGIADTGGEIHLHTADPTRSWHAGVMQDIASYARSRTTLFASGPISDTLSFRIAGQTLHGGGWQYDPRTGATLGDANEGALRAKLLWTPDSRTSLMLSAHWTQDDSEVVTGRPVLGFVANQPIPTLGYRQAEWGRDPAFMRMVGRPGDLKPSEHDTFWGADVKFTRDLGFATLKSISAYETQREGEYTDEDATALATGDVYRNIVSNVFSQELRLESQKSSPLQWVVGMYYDRMRVLQNFNQDATDYSIIQTYQFSHYRENQQAFSQFANLSYKLPRNVTLLGGIEHEADDRRILGMETLRLGKFDLNFPDSGTQSNQFTGNLGVQWQPLSNLMFYYKISKGFRPGGFTANLTLDPAQLKPFKPETVLAQEIGFKSDIIPNRFRLNGAMFYYDYHDQQIVGTYVSPISGPISQYVNVPKSNIWGIEFSADIHPLRHVYITQNFGWERGTYDDFQSVNRTLVNAHHLATGAWSNFYSDFSHMDMGIPKLTLNGEADYRYTVFGHYDLEAGVDWMYRGAQNMLPAGSGVYVLPSYFLLGLHTTFRPANDRWSVTVYSSNVLNRQYASTSGNYSTNYFWIPGPPRFVGGRFSINY
ncbi:TonB-dependent receptor [Gluconacetobacter tumulisoli]|uniref:TonB-dependent receptor n=2 Tax=Gluconacetobacter tumulisoli TaxID=1286189 RepID=A0A7W4PLG8_9PROT|nr:TonB-dependent receptor [Gluconacetobacter tumulisoli]